MIKPALVVFRHRRVSFAARFRPPARWAGPASYIAGSTESQYHNEQRVEKHKPNAKQHTVAECPGQLEIHYDMNYTRRYNKRKRCKGKRRLRLLQV